MKERTIYLLLEPDTKEIRYVGIAKNPKYRFSEHLKEEGSYHKARWIKKLQRENKIPLLQTVCRVPEVEWQYYERLLISFYRSIGCRLINETNGGNGGACKLKSLEVRKKMSERMKGRKVPMWITMKAVEKTKGVPRTEEVKEKLSKIQRYRIKNPTIESRLKCRRKGKIQFSDEQIQKLRNISKEIGSHNAPRPVLQLTIEGELVKEWPSCSSARKVWGDCVSDCCNGEIWSAYGYIWKFKEEKKQRSAILELDENKNIVNKYKKVMDALKVCPGSLYDELKGIHHTCEKHYWCYEDKLKDFKVVKIFDSENDVPRRAVVVLKDNIVIDRFKSVTDAIKKYGWRVDDFLAGRRLNETEYIWKYEQKQKA